MVQDLHGGVGKAGVVPSQGCHVGLSRIKEPAAVLQAQRQALHHARLSRRGMMRLLLCPRPARGCSLELHSASLHAQRTIYSESPAADAQAE